MSIQPKEQNINELFSINKQYFIDFYQRDYQWRKEHVEKLMEDLFHRFSLDYKPDSDVNEEAISKYDWYYLNAYVTNEYNGNTFIVDGQQRLTSLTLILIKLYHLAVKYNEENLRGFLEEHIAGKSLTGHKFWMGQDIRKEVFEDLLANGHQTRNDLPEGDISIRNLYQNFSIIDRQIDAFISDVHKLMAFSIYFLHKVMLIKIDIASTKDVPMVFEVINDRGERLKPYEVLKGKLLGQIDKTEVDEYHAIWQKHVHEIQGYSEGEVDSFFRFYFRSKYTDTTAEYREFDGEYHKTIYEPKWNTRINLKQNTLGVKQFIKNEFSYYADLYIRLLRASEREAPETSPHLYYNQLNDQDRQLLLVMSACRVEDDEEEEKIKLVARLFDKHFTLLQLMGSYDSNAFTESLISLNRNIRDKSSDEIEMIYNQQIIGDISRNKHVEVKHPFDWGYFQDASARNLGIRFIRYYFARIEHAVAEQIEKPTVNYHDLVKNTGWVHGYHIEHIVADNPENRELFGNDEEIFHTERNRLGALLLLRGTDNMASNNETYSEKIKTYSGSLLWNQTLCPDFYHANKDLAKFKQEYGLNFKPYDIFNSEAISERQKLLFELTKIIWA